MSKKRFSFDYLIVALAVFLLAGGPVIMAQSVPVPAPGVQDHSATEIVSCDGQKVEIRYYDFEPADEDTWQTVALGLPGERNFFQRTAQPNGEGPVYIYIDGNLDGIAEEVLNWFESIYRYGEPRENPCKAYILIRKR